MGFVWSFIFQNIFSLVLFGGDSPLKIPFLCDMLQDPNKAIFAMAIMATWQSAGYMLLIYLNGLNNIPEDLYEAASIDGATAWQKFKNITFPMLMPAFTIVFFLTLSQSFKMLDENLALTNGNFGTRMLSLQILLSTRENTPANYGMAQAQAVIFFILIAVISVAQVTVTREGRLKHNEGVYECEKRVSQIVLYLVLGVIAVYTIFPVYFLFVNSFKSQKEIVASPMALPNMGSAVFKECC